MRPSRLLLLSLISLSLSSMALGACSLLMPPWLGGTPAPAPIPMQSSSRVPANVIARHPIVTPRAASTESNGGYRLDSGDRVRVVVAGQDALSNSYAVDAGGAIEISSIGRVSARGLNTIQLSGAIERKLKQSNVREAHVAVQIETYRPITIRGEVANPGQYPYVNNMTTETAIEMAGGLKPSADKKKVTINGGEPDAVTPVPSATDSPVRPGDTVVVPEER